MNKTKLTIILICTIILITFSNCGVSRQTLLNEIQSGTLVISVLINEYDSIQNILDSLHILKYKQSILQSSRNRTSPSFQVDSLNNINDSLKIIIYKSKHHK
jgi:hypothetical protein